MIKKSTNITYSIFILILLNIISGYLYFRIDLTEDKKYSINDETIELLNKVDDIVFIKVYLEGDFPAGFVQLRNACYNLLQEFKIHNDLIEFEFIDPSDRNQKSRNNLYKQLVESGLKPTNLEIKENDRNSQKIIFPGAIINYKNKAISFNFLQSQFGSNPEIVLNNSIENLEFEFSKAFFKLFSEKTKKIAFLKGNNQLSSPYTSDITNSLGVNYNSLSEFFSVEEFDLKSYEIDKDGNPDISKQLKNIQSFDALIIAKPTSSFNELDKFIIDQFIMNGGKVMWFIDGVAMDMDSLRNNVAFSTSLPNNLNLDDMLFKYGVRINSDLIMDIQADQIPIVVGFEGDVPQKRLFPWLYNPLFIPKNNHPIVKNLDAIKSSFVSTIDTIKSKNIQKTPLLFCSPYSKIVKSPHRVSLNILGDPPNIENYNSGLKISAILLEGSFTSTFQNRLTPKTPNIPFLENSVENKMIVVSDGDIIKNHVSKNGNSYPLGYNHFNKVQYEGNKDFIINSMHHLLGNEDLIKINTKQFKIRLLNKAIISTDKLKWQLINLIFPLGLIALLSFSMITYRKNKYK
ncbi:MAG: gliding motility-associated ABC transporter substrate-binding protein GldG [Flavobacteriales bacterium]